MTPLCSRIERTEAIQNAHYIDALRRLYPDAGAEWIDVGGGTAIRDPLGPYLNRAVALDVDFSPTAEDLDRVENLYRGFEIPVQIDAAPCGRRALWRLLGERGYGIQEMKNILTRRLGPEDRELDSSEGIEVVPVDEGTLETWVDVVLRGFAAGDESIEPHVPRARAFVARQGARPYLVRVDGRPAGAALMTLHDGIAWFASTATLPEWRGRGIHAATIRRRLADAAAEGCDLAVVQTSPDSDSQRNCERHGFAVLYTKPTFVEGSRVRGKG